MILLQLLLYSFLVVYAALADTGTKEKGCRLGKTERSDQPEKANSKVVHLLADLDRLSKGIKRSTEEQNECPDEGADKKDTIQIKQSAASSIPKISKIEEVVDEKEAPVSKKTKIDAGKTVKSIVLSKKTSDAPNVKQEATLKNTLALAKAANSTKKHSLSLVKLKETVALSKIIKEAAESSVPVKTKDVPAEKKQAVAKKPNVNEMKNSPLWSLSKLLDAAQKPSILNQKKTNVTETAAEKRGTQYHPSIVPSDASTALQNATSVPASTAAAVVANTDKLTPKAAQTERADQKGKVADAKPATSDLKTSVASQKSDSTQSSSTAKASSSPASTAKASSSPASTADTSKSTAAATTTATKTSDKTAAPVAAATPAKAKPAPDPYAEIAEGPDKPKLPELKTGDDNGGAPLMRLGDNGGVQQMAESGAHMKGGKPLEGQHDVGGLLDSLTDKLNAGAGGVATEQVLPDGEAKFLQNQAGAMDDEAQRQADQWKGLDKLKDLADQADQGKDPNKLAEAEGLLPKEAPDPQEAPAAPSLPMPEDSQSRADMASSSSQVDEGGASSVAGAAGLSSGLTKEMLSKYADSESSLEKQLGSSAGSIAGLSKGTKDGEEDDEYAGADVSPGPDPYSQPEQGDENQGESIGRAQGMSTGMLPHLGGAGNFESADTLSGANNIGDSVSNIPGGAEYLHDTGLDRTGINNLPQGYDSETADPGSQLANNAPEYQPEDVTSDGRQSYLGATMGALDQNGREETEYTARHHIPGRMYASNRRLRSYMYPHMRNYNNYMSGEMYRRDSILKPGIGRNEYTLSFT